ncbi:hypothetical protein [Horticoccus sp. 23ND18S-11]
MNNDLLSLYTYWCRADAVRVFIYSDLPTARDEYPPWLLEMGNMDSKFQRIFVWYAMLYVVVEGFQELRLQDAQVEELIRREDYISQLRRFRNSIFHFQKDFETEKYWDFLKAKESEIWVRKLNSALEGFFERVLPINQHLEILKRRHLEGNRANKSPEPTTTAVTTRAIESISE